MNHIFLLTTAMPLLIFTFLLVIAAVIGCVWLLSNFIIKKGGFTRKLKAINNEHATNVLKAQVEIQEQTFLDISRDIHDNIGQQLSYAKLQLARSKTEPQINVDDVEGILTNAISDLRDLSRSLRSDLVRSEGLIDAIKADLAILEKTRSFEIAYNVKGEAVFLPADHEIILYRIYQEAIQNIIKHSKASKVDVMLNYNKHDLFMQVSDNGIGLSEKFILGQGLKNIEARAKSLGGIAVISGNTTGTIYNIQIPLYATAKK